MGSSCSKVDPDPRVPTGLSPQSSSFDTEERSGHGPSVPLSNEIQECAIQDKTKNKTLQKLETLKNKLSCCGGGGVSLTTKKKDKTLAGKGDKDSGNTLVPESREPKPSQPIELTLRPELIEFFRQELRPILWKEAIEPLHKEIQTLKTALKQVECKKKDLESQKHRLLWNCKPTKSSQSVCV